MVTKEFRHLPSGGRQDGRNPGVMGAGSLWEAGGESVGGGIPKGVGARRNREKFCNIVKYFVIGKADRGGNHYGRGQELGM